MIGKANGVVAYSNSKYAEDSYLYGIYTGIKWECVEYARRYLLMRYGITFHSVNNAYELFDMKYFITLENNVIPIQIYPNGSNVSPKKDSLLIWGKEWQGTGHVAVVIDIHSHFISIAEQNIDKPWISPNISRILPFYSHHSYFIDSPYLLGWINY
jgi:hypothetical protein